MRRVIVIYLALIIMVLGPTSGCVSKKQTVRVIKPKKHLFTYNPKWHKKAKRTKTVRMRN